MKTIIFTRRSAPLLPLALGCAVALLAGCASEPESYVVSAPPPSPVVAPTATVVAVPVVPNVPAGMTATQTTQTTRTTETTPAGTVVTTTTTQPVATPPPATNAIIVTQAPPAVPADPVVAQPTSQHSLVSGYWRWQGNQYQWVTGHWEVPPYAGARWTAPRWEPENGAYRFYAGRWD